MSKNGKLGLIIGVISAVATVTAAITAFLIVREKKKRDEEELDRYLDCSIQEFYFRYA